MYNPAAKTGLAGEMLGQVDRIVVARKLGEPDHVFVLDCLADRRPHADGKFFEIERPKQGVLHAANETFNRWELTEKSPDDGQSPSVKSSRRYERLRLKRGDRGDRPQRIFLVQPLQFNRISRRSRRLSVQRPMYAPSDAQRVQARSRGAGDSRV